MKKPYHRGSGKPAVMPSPRPECVILVYPNGDTKEVIDPEIAERDRREMEKLYREKSQIPVQE